MLIMLKMEMLEQAGRSEESLALLGRRTQCVLAAGGEGDDGPLISTELFNPARNTWAPAGSLALARSSFQMVRLRCGNILAAGGVDDEGTIAGTELFNSITHIWAAAGILGTGRGFSQMA